MAGSFDIHAIEQEARALWRRMHLLEQIEKQNASGEHYFLLDGPPYANNIPHVGHVRNTVYKDLYLRRAMMQGKNVLFQPGFDTHGLPIENMVEKQLGITSKQDIERLGIAEFTKRCRESAALNKDLWIKVYENLGSWYSWKEPYMTYENSYIESAWWAFAQIWNKGYVYEGKRPVHWCPHCQTALAGYEVTDSYKVISDPGVYVKFKVRGEDNTYLLAFTTTPWTLPSNVALVVNGNEEYVYAKTSHGTLILAHALLSTLERIKVPYNVIKTVKGTALDGLRYESLMDVPVQHTLAHEQNALRVFLSIPLLKERVASKTAAKKGIAAKDLFEDFVTVTDGTGIVHCAPGHGHTDNAVGVHYGMPALSPLNDAAEFTNEVGKYAGMAVREASHVIAEDLSAQGKLLHHERIDHSYPLCWRCKTPLIFRLSNQWFIRLEQIKDAILQSNNEITWQPDFAHERMENWVLNAGDWNFSRQRYWGTPIPIWKCACGEHKVLASKAELAEHVKATGKTLPADVDLHAAGLYEITCTCGKHMKKVPDIFDVWYDSGCAPFASLGYPYHNKKIFDEHYPVSRINESQDQIRGWFYHLLLVGQLTFDARPLQTISMPGWVVDEKGEKMSKSLGNVVTATDAIAEFGADPLRFYYSWDVAPYALQKFSKNILKTEVNKLFTILWNLSTLCTEQAAFHTERATEVPQGELPTEDQWLLSRTETVLRAYLDGMERFELQEGSRLLHSFIVSDVSRTYVQFTRERAEDDPRVATLLRQTLLRVLIALAPITPHVSEMAYQRLRAPQDPASVHLCPWPSAGESNPELELEFATLQELLTGLLSARDKAQISLRWPILEARAFGDARFNEVLEKHRELLLLKSNIKSLTISPLEITRTLTPDVGALGRTLGQDTAAFLEEFAQHSAAILAAIDKQTPYAWRNHEITRDHVVIAHAPPAGWICLPCGEGLVCVNTQRTPALDREGYARELTRRIQQLRKTAGLKKLDRIALQIMARGTLGEAVQEYEALIAERTGADSLTIVAELDEGLEHRVEDKVRQDAFALGFSRL